MTVDSVYDPKKGTQVCGACGHDEFSDTLANDNTNVTAVCCGCGETNVMYCNEA